MVLNDDTGEIMQDVTYRHVVQFSVFKENVTVDLTGLNLDARQPIRIGLSSAPDMRRKSALASVFRANLRPLASC